MAARKHTKSHAEVRREFDAAGISIRQWAREHGFSPWVIYGLLSKRTIPVRGEGHRAAVALGIKRPLAKVGADLEQQHG